MKKKKSKSSKQNNPVLKRLGALDVNDDILQEKYDILLEEYNKIDLKFKVIEVKHRGQLRELKEKHKKQLNEAYNKCERLKKTNRELCKTIRRLKLESRKSGDTGENKKFIKVLSEDAQARNAVRERLNRASISPSVKAIKNRLRGTGTIGGL